MSIWSKIGDFGGKIWHEITGTPSEADKRAQRAAANAQIDYYKQQSSIADSEISRKREEQMSDKRRIEEKQIRSLRRNFRPAGFLDSGASDLSQTLG